jgi:23S rRNA pseudouridine2605 synthase
MQLNKYLALSGVCSRRNALIVIKQGEIFVNGHSITEPFYLVKPHDVVMYKKKIIKPEQKIYVMLNKPDGYITTLYDPHHKKTVYELVKSVSRERIYPIGRLDQDTTGVLLVTNDGELTQKLSHPRYEVSKIYHVLLDRPLIQADLERIRKGLSLRDGRIVPDRVFYIAGKTKKHIGVELHSGKKRIVRRMFGYLEYNVISLDRVSYAGLTKRRLAIGKWRHLTMAEVQKIKKM